MNSTTSRRNEYDVTDRVNTTDPVAVSAEVSRLYQDLYQRDNPGNMVQAAKEDIPDA